MAAGIVLFFLDMEHGPDSALPQLYGFAHLVFFMLMAWGLSTLPSLARRPFFLQFVLIMSAVFLVGGIIEVIQPYFGRSASWRDLGIDLLGGLLGLTFLAPARHGLRRELPVCGQFAVVVLAVVLFYSPGDHAVSAVSRLGQAWALAHHGESAYRMPLTVEDNGI